MRIKLDPDAIAYSSLLEKIAHVQVKDCFQDEDTLFYIVPQAQVGKALGKGAVNLKKLQERFNKRIKVIGYADNVEAFVKNAIHPLQVESITLQDNAVVIKDSNKKTKGLLIGREGKNLAALNRAVQRFFNVEVKVE